MTDENMTDADWARAIRQKQAQQQQRVVDTYKTEIQALISKAITNGRYTFAYKEKLTQEILLGLSRAFIHLKHVGADGDRWVYSWEIKDPDEKKGNTYYKD